MATRPTHGMPEDVRAALKTGKVEDAYKARPPYQRNDYIGWITEAKRDATREKRIKTMVADLKKGGTYMGMPHKPSAH